MADVNQLIEMYVQLRDKKDVIKARHKEELASYDEALGKLEGKLAAALEENGVEKLAGSAGTAFFSTKKSYKVVDWDATLEYVIDNGAFDVLEKRVAKSAVEERGDVPGLEPSEYRTISVRRK